MPSHCYSSVIDEMTSHPPHLELDDSLTLDELLGSLGLIKKGKAGGKMGILPEMLLHGGEELLPQALAAYEGCVGSRNSNSRLEVTECCCDHSHPPRRVTIGSATIGGVLAYWVWWERCLLVYTIQERLQHITERILPESQCGFHKGKECNDMMFVERQLVEKCREHDNALFVLFVDLKKA